MPPPFDERRLDALFERSPVGVVFVALDGTVTAANPAACQLWGRTEAELVGSSSVDIVHPDDLDAAARQVRALLAGEVEEIRLERRYIQGDGTVVWGESLTQVVRSPDGTPLCLHSVLVDVTERKRAEQARSWLQEIIQSSQDAIIGSTPEGVILTWNAGAERIFGYTAEEAVGRNASMLRPSGIEDETGRVMSRIGLGEGVEQRVVRLRKDGTAVTLLADSTPIHDEAGEVIGTATIAAIWAGTERDEATIRSLLESAPDAVICVDAKGLIAFVNARAEQLFGYARGELIGEPGETLLPDRTKQMHSAGRQKFYADPQPLQVGADQEFAVRRKDGSEFPAEVSLSAIQTQDGPLVSVAIRDGSERRQAAIVASSSDAIVGRSLDGTITSWNAAAERIYGYSAAEAIGHDMAVLLPPEHSGKFADATARVHSGDPVEPFESRRTPKDGVAIDVSVTVSPIRDTHGTVVGSSSVARDITQSKRAVEAFRDLEARSSAILESALDCIITMDHHGRVVEFNPAAERTFGYTRSEALGRTMAALIIPPSLRDRHTNGLAHYLATGEGPILGERVELTAMRADGTEFPVELAVTRVDIPGEPLFTGYLRDLTEQRRVQQKLIESEQLLQAMLDNSPALICLTDSDGRYLFMNRPLADRFGIDREKATGCTIEEIWPADVARTYRADDSQVLRTGAPMQYESVSVHPDGDRTYLTVKFPVFDTTGTAYGTASIATDITDRKTAEAERELLGQRLRQSERLESLGQLAGGVAHDFNNLLGAILGYAAFVAEATADNPAVKADVEQIQAAAERAARLTRQLLIVGRRESINTEIVDLNSIVADIRVLLSRTIGAHIELTVIAGGQLPTIRADRGQIEQVLLNLVVNARDAMPSGGTVTIATTVVDLDDDYLRLHPDAVSGRHVELSVSDTGVGMPPEVSSRIFEPFFTTKPQGQGTGLGLATVYGIVTKAGGSVIVYSEPGMGTTFRVLLPAVEEPATPALPRVSEDLDGHGEAILVVDDEAAIMHTTARILRRRGYVVFEAASGSEALAIAGEHGLDLLLTDSVMPHMSGRELAERIGVLLPELPVLFMSGYSEGVVGPQHIIDEGSALVEKPFNAETILTRVRGAIYGAGRHRASSPS